MRSDIQPTARTSRLIVVPCLDLQSEWRVPMAKLHPDRRFVELPVNAPELGFGPWAVDDFILLSGGNSADCSVVLMMHANCPRFVRALNLGRSSLAAQAHHRHNHVMALSRRMPLIKMLPYVFHDGSLTRVSLPA